MRTFTDKWGAPVTDREYLQFLQKARDLLRETCGDELGDVHVLVYYAISRHGMEFKLPCNDDAPEWPEEVVGIPAEAQSALPMRRVHERLLLVMTATPVPAKRLAVLAGFSRCSSYVRTALTELVRWGRAQHTPDGYRLPA